MYSADNTLLEKQTANLSDIWGENLAISGLNFVNGLDSMTQEIYDFTFVVGKTDVPPGYRATGTNMSTEIQFIFENIDGFNSDLGTGLKDGDELGCVVIAGLLAGPQPIKCYLHVGPNYLDQPMIRVTNYRTIPAGTTVTVSVANIRNMGQTDINTAYAAVMLFYHDLSTQAYLYRPTSKLMLNTTTLSTVPFSTYLVSYPGNNVVLTPTTLNITLTPTYNVKTTDYFVLTFPMNTIDPFNPTTITCSNCQPQVYYKANVMRLYPNSAITAGTQISFSLTNFPTSAYAMYNNSLAIKCDGYLDGKQKNSQSVTIQRTVEKCTLSTVSITSVSSLNGGEVNVTYVFSFIMNIVVPVNGALSVTTPAAYGNLLTNNAICNTTIPYPAYCDISTANRIDIYLNGSVLDQTMTYKLWVTGLSNPNTNNMTNLTFQFTSYFDSNIYQSHRICENPILPPTIMMKSIRTCGFSFNVDFHNSNLDAKYNFLISCTDVIRANSVLYIYMHNNYNISNPISRRTCFSY